MKTKSIESAIRGVAVVMATTAMLAGCASTPPASDSGTPAGSAAKPAPAPPAPAPAPPPVPELTPAQAKAQAQRLALDAVDQLQNGDEATARQTLDQAIALDPTNDLAKKLKDQIKADAQKELGPVFFRYTVQKRRFAVQARAAVPGRPFPLLHPRQVQRHGKSEQACRRTGDQDPRTPARHPAARAAPAADLPTSQAPAVPEAKPRDDVAELLQRGKDLEAKGNLEGAYAAYSEAAQEDAGQRRGGPPPRRDAHGAPARHSIAKARRRSSARISTWRSPSGIASSRSIPTTRRPSSNASAPRAQEKMTDKFGGAAPAGAPATPPK